MSQISRIFNEIQTLQYDLSEIIAESIRVICDPISNFTHILWHHIKLQCKSCRDCRTMNKHNVSLGVIRERRAFRGVPCGVPDIQPACQWTSLYPRTDSADAIWLQPHKECPPHRTAHTKPRSPRHQTRIGWQRVTTVHIWSGGRQLCLNSAHRQDQ